MKINVQASHEVFLSDDQVNEITTKRLNSLVHPGKYLEKKKGVMYLCQDDPFWRHGSSDTHCIREATELDLAVFKVLDEIRK